MKSSFSCKYRWTIMLILAIIFVSACEKIELGEPFTCRAGTKYWVNNTLSFSIDSLRDYRCPRDVICIWGGDVDLYLHIQHNFTETDTTAHLYKRNPLEAGDYIWQILEVNPWPESFQSPDLKEYRIKMIVTKN